MLVPCRRKGQAEWSTHTAGKGLTQITLTVAMHNVQVHRSTLVACQILGNISDPIQNRLNMHEHTRLGLRLSLVILGGMCLQAVSCLL